MWELSDISHWKPRNLQRIRRGQLRSLDLTGQVRSHMKRRALWEEQPELTAQRGGTSVVENREATDKDPLSKTEEECCNQGDLDAVEQGPGMARKYSFQKYSLEPLPLRHAARPWNCREEWEMGPALMNSQLPAVNRCLETDDLPLIYGQKAKGSLMLYHNTIIHLTSSHHMSILSSHIITRGRSTPIPLCCSLHPPLQPEARDHAVSLLAPPLSGCSSLLRSLLRLSLFC
ncbi:uncharacterized protein LOC123580648 isoform X2 [Leopardus geoffroyi]|uniref:uncharacterized protein LOC123580648 isoform X2 n=1 Tax=Leopardus geoffroyi TaxID=46844 RepID=UPI001E260A32|nr:uncharacterized protein LOC123580648 isoform X2 [Leopardus geoffroyi]